MNPQEARYLPYTSLILTTTRNANTITQKDLEISSNSVDASYLQLIHFRTKTPKRLPFAIVPFGKCITQLRFHRSSILA